MSKTERKPQRYSVHLEKEGNRKRASCGQKGTIDTTNIVALVDCERCLGKIKDIK